ncbi:alpha/beta hydrolase [Candidatus Woesearchaeota archaeon]|nr:alpha/beta hydrolase [Candidatus Woesearchaeota archaeon]
MQKAIRSFDRAKINYRIARHSRDFLVFLHGLGGDLTVWGEIRRFFHKHGFSTIAIDLRGHGLSGRPDSFESYSLENFARDVDVVLTREKIRKFILVGHCFGGVISINFYKLFPKKARAYVLISSPHNAPGLARLLKIGTIKSILSGIARYKGTAKTLSHRDFTRFAGTSDLDIKRIYSDIKHTSLRSWLFSFQQLASFEGTSVLRKMDKKTLLIVGGKDLLVGADSSKRMYSLLRNSSLRIMPEANHIIPLNNPELLEQEILEFVSDEGLHKKVGTTNNFKNRRL